MMKKFFTLILLMGLFVAPSVAEEKKPFALKSLIVEHEGDLPYEYSCWVTQLNPPLVIEHPPEGTRSLVITMVDENAIQGEWTHWVTYNVSPDTRLIESGSNPGQPALNDFGEEFYHAPCPSDDKPHRYVFDLYALKTTLYHMEGSTRVDLLRAIKGKVIEKTSFAVIYENPKW